MYFLPSTSITILLPHSLSFHIACARMSASTIMSRLHSNICHTCLLSWAAAAAAAATARSHALARAAMPLAVALRVGLPCRRVVRHWHGVVKRRRDVAMWRRRRMGVMMLCVVCGWKRFVLERRKRKMTEVEVMKRFAQERAEKTGVLLTCSCTLFAWCRVTTRMAALHVSHKRINARHQHIIITTAFAAWSQRCKSKSLAFLLHRKRQCNPVQFVVCTP
jgi:hypothetical protein